MADNKEKDDKATDLLAVLIIEQRRTNELLRKLGRQMQAAAAGDMAEVQRVNWNS